MPLESSQDRSAMRPPAESPELRRLRIRRIYPVAPEKVWLAWTDPRAVSRWFGPGKGDSVTSAELDVRVGGRYRIAFVAPDGVEHVASGVYQEVVENRLLVFSWLRRGMPELASQVTLELRPVSAGTELSFLHEFPDVAARDDHRRGWLPTFEKLAAFIGIGEIT
jgi:uncharacterized protein YndB with AHSA1/START domain